MTVSQKIKTVCIITPGAIGSNPRVVKEADALEANGLLVRVIATRTLNHVDMRDAALIGRKTWEIERIDLRSRAKWRLRRLPQLAIRQVFAATGISNLAAAAFSPFTTALTQAALCIPADLYIAHYPAALPAAALAARAYSARYAFDAEDFHQGDWPLASEYDLERSLVCAIESKHLPRCAFVTAASPGIADAYAKAYGILRPTVVLNAFPLRQAPEAPTARGAAEPGPSIYWFSQTIGPDRGLECAVRAIAKADLRPHLYLRGTLAPGYAEHLNGLATSSGAEGRVHYLPPAAPDEMERLAAGYDLGLAAETGHTIARQVCLTNKLFSFLLAGLPPLMSDTPAQLAFAAESGLNDLVYSHEDPTSLAVLIDSILGSPPRLEEERARAWRLARERYNWEQEAATLVHVVKGVAECKKHHWERHRLA